MLIAAAAGTTGRLTCGRPIATGILPPTATITWAFGLRSLQLTGFEWIFKAADPTKFPLGFLVVVIKNRPGTRKKEQAEPVLVAASWRLGEDSGSAVIENEGSITGAVKKLHKLSPEFPFYVLMFFGLSDLQNHTTDNVDYPENQHYRRAEFWEFWGQYTELSSKTRGF